METVICAVLVAERKLIPIPRHLVDTLAVLSLGRIFTLALMVALLARREYKLRSKGPSSEETQSLLENGDGPANGYGHASHGASSPASKQDNKSRALGWIDYLASFKVLFPYLWSGASATYSEILAVTNVYQAS